MGSATVTTRRLIPARDFDRTREIEGRTGFHGARIESRIELRPLGATEMLDAAIALFLRRFGVCMGIAAGLWIPVELVSELLFRSLPEARNLLSSATQIPVQVLTTSFVCAVVGGELMGPRYSVGVAGRLRLMRLVGLALITLVTFCMSVPFVCCFFLMYVVMWLFSVAPAVYILEAEELSRLSTDPPWSSWATDAFVALGRSVRLAWGWSNLGRWMGWSITIAAIIAPLGTFVFFTRDLTMRSMIYEHLPLRGMAVDLFIVVLGALFMGIGSALTAVCMCVYYVDLRVRKEGLDLEADLDRMRARALPSSRA